ncbi:glycoside hydrolase/phage tail family protein [uncultured Amaricoccus sp.]|uniref:baseplate multidomain protein megatron n=1 Tax=uncultured Amaricoccus sp. TaxID=339341 RepID=UPI002620D682|nr:glycoside hydrolase/phage tail family protein [uncultured Amaricoccus sp.]
MATLVLAAAGSALGGAMGGSIAGLTSLALGKAIGATLGSVVDQRLLGLGAEPVETGKVDRFRVMGSSEGAALPRVFGRMRVAGQIIWSSRFLEHVSSQNVGGKGGGQKVREYSYTVSLAIALCEGEVIRVGRIWADGLAIDQSTLTMRLHHGGEMQTPDPLISAIEGDDFAPAYRGTAYAVLENLDLSPYGNRIPQFNFEVFRRSSIEVPGSPAQNIRAVALVPGTGEYALATEPVRFDLGKGESKVANVHNDLGVTDLKASIGQLIAELPKVGSVSLIVSWFGNDLRCDRCELRPGVEQSIQDGTPMHWKVSGTSRSAAKVVSQIDGRPVFGGTPSDEAVIQAIRHLRGMGLQVVFYPFILMDIQEKNGLIDPWTGSEDQPNIPWRGRITLSSAPSLPGTPDKTSEATEEVAVFFGRARQEDFQSDDASVTYIGADEWSYRRFILHYAHLCVAAGGVDAFCIGSEMRGVSQIRGEGGSYPAVTELCDLASDVRSVLGATAKIGYAADWSEYFGHQPNDGSGDVAFHLDPLWSHPAIDFIGIDNYMPISDWRDGSNHTDAVAGSIYNLDYLTGNVAGGEGYDWYYASSTDRDVQARSAIIDGAYGEDWTFRYKDLVSWWSNEHVNRVGGVKVSTTHWRPQSKPIWFTELGCPAVNKGTNQPNVFHDPKSSESFFPYYSNGSRDDFIQSRYLQAMFLHWGSSENNPVSAVYGGPMVDMTRAHVWAWDARPWPDFPNRMETWADGDNYSRGHWLNGRMTMVPLAEVVSELCNVAELDTIDVAELYGAVSGYVVEAVESVRQSLQPLMLAYAFDSVPVGAHVGFSSRDGLVVADRGVDRFVVCAEEPVVTFVRAPSADVPSRVTFGFVEADADYGSGAVEAVHTHPTEPNTAQSSASLVLSNADAEAIAARWLAEGKIARDTVAFRLPPSDLRFVPGDVLAILADERSDLYRIDRVDEAGHRVINAVRVEPATYEAPANRGEVVGTSKRISAQSEVYAEFLDLPLLTGDEVPHAPHVAVFKYPWAGSVAVFSAGDNYGYAPNRTFSRPAILGETLDALPAGVPGRWMRATVRVRIRYGALESRSAASVLNGANVAALRDGSSSDWEVFQFTKAELVAPQVYKLSGLLRGQAGTDGQIPVEWPAGTDFVLIDRALAQIDLPASARGIERHYRIGPTSKSYDDASFVHRVLAFDGVGLRPYRPTHLRAVRSPSGDISVSWTRRTRIDGDNWQGVDVPLGEDSERYHVRIFTRAAVLREYFVEAPNLTYSKAAQEADDFGSVAIFEVAQVSGRFGPGGYERIEFNG